MTDHDPIGLADPSLLRQQCLVDGQWCDADRGGVIAVTNPATGEMIGTVPDMGAAETARAITAADRAFRTWRAAIASERARILRRLFNLMLENREDLARIMTAEQGKPLAESRGEIGYAASFIEWFAEEAKRIYGDVIPENAPGRRILVRKQPIGVFAAVTPWNFPAAMITRKAGPGWAAGCTGVIRPASQTPFSALALGVLAERAGMPAGVCNIVTGSPKPVGAEMTSNPIVRKFSFTGSTAVGAQLLAQCAPTIKKTSMELGGNAPFIVFDDADLDAAVEGAIAAKYRNAGQTCVCANRLLVQSGIHDAFVEKLAAKVRGFRLGDGFQDGVTMGPLIDEAAVSKSLVHIHDALDKGARLVAGGKPDPLGLTFLQPTVLAECAGVGHLLPRGNLRPRGAGLPLRNGGRRYPHGQRHRVRAGRLLLYQGCRPHLPRLRSTGIWHRRRE